MLPSHLEVIALFLVIRLHKSMKNDDFLY